MPTKLARTNTSMAPIGLPTAVQLEVVTGQTNFPLRPVTTGRYLIGAGSNCHLQLGGDGVPFLHSILLVEGSTVTIEAVVPSPSLRHNGQKVQIATLNHGDRISIDAFEIVARIDHQQLRNRPVQSVATFQSRSAEANPEEEWREFDEEELGELTAAELVDRLGDEFEIIEQSEAAQRCGVAALLDAAWIAAEDIGEQELSIEQQLLSDLEGLSSELQERIAGIQAHDTEREQQTSILNTAQEKLAQQIAKLNQAAIENNSERGQDQTRRARA